MECSTVIGMLSEKRDIFEDGDETLYMTTISIRGHEFPVVGYDTAFRECQGGKVAVVCYLKSERKGGSLFTYLRAITIEPCDENCEETSEMVFEGVVAKKNKLFADIKKGEEVQRFIIRYRDSEGNQNLVHCIAKGKLARKVDKMRAGDLIKIQGILFSKERTLEFFVKEVA